MVRPICREFEGAQTDSDLEIKVVLKGVHDLKSARGDMKKDEQGRFYDTGYSAILPKADEPLHINFDERVLRKGIVGKIATFWNWSYLTPIETVAKNIIYDILEPVAHRILLEEKLGFIHGSSVAKGERSVLFTGEGGIGKTAMCLAGVSRGYEYMNDDLSLVDSLGHCYHHPKKLQVYGYNIKYHPDLKKRLFLGRGMLDRMQWQMRYLINGPSNVRRRTAPKELFEGSIRHSARISKVVFLRRDNELDMRKMKKEDFIASEMRIIHKEFSDYMNALKHVDEEGLSTVINGTKKLYGELFDHVDCLEVTVPVNYDFKKLFTLLEEEHFKLTK